MKNTVFDYIEDKEKVLINKGDLLMLLHTMVSFFSFNDAPVDFCAEALEAIFRRNRYNRNFVNEFTTFSKLMADTSEQGMVEKKANEILKEEIREDIDEGLKDFYRSLLGDEDEEEEK